MIFYSHQIQECEDWRDSFHLKIARELLQPKVDSDLVGDMCCWADTPQGEDFWAEQAEELTSSGVQCIRELIHHAYKQGLDS